MRAWFWKTALCVFSVFLIAGVAVAQEEGAAPEVEEVATEAAPTRQIEEVTVTARRVEESLDDAPLTIRALTSDAVAELGIFDVDNVALNTPGIHISNYFGARDDPNVAFRGMDAGTIDRIAQISSAYIDGVFLPGATSWISVGNVERTEVVKGPQSALYGRSAFGGAINFVFKQPTMEWAGDAALTFGENGRFDLGAGVGGPISQSVSFHTFVRGYEYDGGYDNPFPESERLGSQSTKALEASLRWDISDSVGVKFRGFYSQDKDGPASFAWFNESLHNCGPFETDGQSGFLTYFCGELSPDIVTDFGYDTKTQPAQGISWPKPNFGMDRDFALGSMHIDAMLGQNVSLTSITSYLQEELDAMQDFSGTQTLLQYFNTIDTLKSQELKVQGSGSNFDWLAGFYYLDADYESKPNGFGCADPSYMFAPVPFPGSGCVLFTGAAVRGSFNLSVTTPHRLVENTALFGSFTWHVSDRVSLTADARAARETLDFGSVTAVDGEVRELKDDFDSFLPRVVFDWKPSDYSTFYAVVSTGNKAGNFNAEVASMCASCINDFEDEFGIGVSVPESEAVNYEAGYKLVTRNGKHRFNAAVFLFDWTNQAFTQATPFDTDGDGEINDDLVDYQTVAGESEIKGAELFYSGWLGQYVNVSASYAYNDAVYKVFEDAVHRRVFGSADASGKQMPRSPKSSATLGLGVVFPLGNVWEFNARGDYVYRGSSYTWAVNLAETGETNRLSLRAGVRSDRWDLSVWMNNVTDDDTLMAIRRFSSLANFLSPTWWAGLPGVQEAGVTIRVNF